MNNSCASTDGQSHNLLKLTKIGGIQPNFRNIAAHLPEYVDQSDPSKSGLKKNECIGPIKPSSNLIGQFKKVVTLPICASTGVVH